MTKETFVRTVEGVLASLIPQKNINSVLHSKITAVGRRFEARSLSAAEAAQAIKDIFPLDVNEEVRRAIEKALR